MTEMTQSKASNKLIGHCKENVHVLASAALYLHKHEGATLEPLMRLVGA